MSIAMPMAMPRIRRQPQPPTKIGSIMLSHINLLDLTALDEPIGTPMDLPATILGNPYVAQVRLTKVQAAPGLVTSLEWQQALLQELDGCAKVMRQMGQTTYTSSWDIHDGRQQYLFELRLAPTANSNADTTSSPTQPSAVMHDTHTEDVQVITPSIPVRTAPSPPPRPAQPQRIQPRH